MSLPARFLLDFGGIKQRGDDRGGAYSDRHSCLHELFSPTLVLPFDVVISVGHARFSMAFGATLEAA